MRIFKYALLTFIFFTAIAAFGHSSWVLSTAFGGNEPRFDAVNIWGGDHFGWALSGWLIAFALDFGLMAISHDIQDGFGNRWKGIAFLILCLFTYLLQLTYMAIHREPMNNGVGVPEYVGWFAQKIMDYSIYIFPAMLPVGTAIYTVAYKDQNVVPLPVTPLDSKPKDNQLVPASAPVLEPADEPKELAPPVSFSAQCDLCDWREEFDTERKAQVNLTRHKNKIHGDSNA